MRYKHVSINIRQLISLALYYCIFRYFPSSTFPVLGPISRRLRYVVCKNIFEYCGKNVNIERMAFFASGTHIRIGDNSGLGIKCYIPANTIIGANVMMGPNCYIFQANHKYERTDIPIIMQGLTSPRQTVIGNDVWIGRNVSILPGKKIGSGSIIGVGSIVTKDVDEYTVVGGNPAKIIKRRLI